MDTTGGFGCSIPVEKPSLTTAASSSNNADPSFVWKEKEVAETFTNIRDSLPLGKEQLDLMVRIIRTFQPGTKDSDSAFTWVDVGCGDGVLGRKLLQEFPGSKGIFLDFSEPMLETAKSKIDKLGMASRVSLVKGDLSRPQWMESLPKSGDQRPTVDLIVSSFAIHHLTNERKQALFQEFYNILTPGGLFLNLEHVASPTSAVEKMFDGAFVDSMYDFFQGTKTYEECQQAVDYDLSVDAEANILVPTETQCEWLREIGFEHVDCYFKFLILALFGGVKKKDV